MSEKKKDKSKYRKVLNQLFFGSEEGIDWTKLSISDLQMLVSALSNPTDIIKRLGGIPKDEAKIVALKDFVGKWEGPIISMIRDLIGGEEGPIISTIKGAFGKRSKE